MTTLDQEIEAYNDMKGELEAAHRGEWVVVHDRRLCGTFPSFQQAADLALRKLGDGPYLIRRIGASPVPVPVSILHPVPDGAS
ncbi:MAG TPA: hypothetical protein VEI03_03900 [Stellaceae bacterium]|nr:hypothetical protein [Stellaceae bacterium]